MRIHSSIRIHPNSSHQSIHRIHPSYQFIVSIHRINPYQCINPSVSTHPYQSIRIHLFISILIQIHSSIPHCSNTILYNNDKKTKGGLADIAEAKSNQQYECPTSLRDRRQVQPCRVVSAPYQPPLVCRI